MSVEYCPHCNKRISLNDLFKGSCEHVTCVSCLSTNNDIDEKEFACYQCGTPSTWKPLTAELTRCNSNTRYFLINEKIKIAIEDAIYISYCNSIRQMIAAKMSPTLKRPITFRDSKKKDIFPEFKIFCTRINDGDELAIAKTIKWISDNWEKKGRLEIMLDYITSMVLLPAKSMFQKKIWLKLFLEHLNKVRRNQRVYSNQLLNCKNNYCNLSTCIYNLLKELNNQNDKEFLDCHLIEAVDNAFSGISTLREIIKNSFSETAYTMYIKSLRNTVVISNSGKMIYDYTATH